MKRIMYSLAIAASAFCLGCGKSEPDTPPTPPEPYTPSTAEYKALLEKRASSVDGANINIWQEVGKFENASPSEKRDLYNRVKYLVK